MSGKRFTVEHPSASGESPRGISTGFMILTVQQKVFDIIHPQRRNLTAIRGYVRLGGLPDNPRTDPQDRSWFGPHDRLFTEEESEALTFVPGPDYGIIHSLALVAQ